MQTRVCSGYDLTAVFEAVDAEIARGLRPTLGIVFCSVKHDLQAISRGFARRGIALVGATTAGEIAHAETLEESCVAMLLEADPAAFEVRFRAASEGEPMAEVARALGRYAVERFANPIVIAFGSGIRSDGEQVVRGVRAGAGRDIPLFGGVAGDDLIMVDTFVLSAEGVSEAGLAGLVLDGDRFEVEGIATNGWQAVGVEKTVTRAEGNVVYTIDGEPALSVYRKYLDFEPSGKTSGATELGVQYPLSVRRDNGTSVIRAPLFFGEDGSLTFAGTVPQGSRIKFCIPPALDIVERVVAEARGVQQALPDADALILVSCKARHMALGPLALDEIQELYNLWNAPMAGYFSYGEIGAREPRHCDFHTETCTLIALRQLAA